MQDIMIATSTYCPENNNNCVGPTHCICFDNIVNVVNTCYTCIFNHVYRIFCNEYQPNSNV